MSSRFPPRPRKLASPGRPDAQTQSRQALDGTGQVAGVQRGPCLAGQDKLPGLQPLPAQQDPTRPTWVGDTVPSWGLHLPPWKRSTGTSATAHMTATFSLCQRRPRDPTAPTPTLQGAPWMQAFPGGRVHRISPRPALQELDCAQRTPDPRLPP